MAANLNNRQNFICGVCRDVFTSPRMLPRCHHSFCLGCIENLAKRASGKTSFKCPTCRERIKIPPYGVKAFQVNFYISEEDLEQARRGSDSSVCKVHQGKQLDLFCVRCDQSLCILCKLTKHENHKTQDLSEAATRCKQELEVSQGRLDDMVKHLKVKLKEATQHEEEIQQKEIEMKKEVESRHGVLVARANKWQQLALTQVSTMTRTILDEAKNNKETISCSLHSLRQLQERIEDAVSESSEADIVNVEREMRLGAGSQEELEKIRQKLPTNTSRLVLRFDRGSITGKDVENVIGIPKQVNMSCSESTAEIVIPVFQFGKSGEDRDVQALAICDDGTVYVSYGGGFPNGDTDAKVIAITERPNGINTNCLASRTSCCFQLQNKFPTFVMWRRHLEGGGIVLHAKAAKLFHLVYTGSGQSAAAYEVRALSLKPLKSEHVGSNYALTVTGKPAAFDSSSDGCLFAIVLEQNCKTAMTGREKKPLLPPGTRAANLRTAGSSKETRNFPKRVVCLYNKDYRNPVATYTPPISSFFPTDVCFWISDEKETLIIADGQNDVMHVVNVDDGSCRFERFLATGNPHVMHPTALNTDSSNRLWIGCGNGWILRCEPKPAKGSLSAAEEAADEMNNPSSDDFLGSPDPEDESDDDLDNESAQ